MDYELAKKLKDAGFKVDHDIDADCIYRCSIPDDWGDDESTGTITHFPTLSELIEACKKSDGWFELIETTYADRKWEARLDHGITRAPDMAWGTTPEIAVANLWLALNQK